ncbi:hypothetical protein ABZ953_19705 [Streptomyces sp. NPDC046465]|uniref:hypothetical protein n=1 Tax=Streptomyces sp. NPDC046465 TaxID=3155810 RepID=UPI0033EA465B
MTMTNAIHWPEWVPLAGHHLRVSGVHFDAVRIQGVRGEQVAARLIAETDDDAGPVICEATGFRWMYFLVAPGAAKERNWPLGVQRFGGAGCRTVTYIGVPALNGNTWPLLWYSEPTPSSPYVDPGHLLAALGPVSP